MLTRRGWWLLGVAGVLLVPGLLVRIEELFPIALAAIVLVIISLVWVRNRSWALETARDIRPQRVGAGDSARVELAVRNLSGRSSPVLSMRDPFDGGRFAASFAVAPLAADEGVRAAYRLPTGRRGVYRLGPLEFRLTDPFGLAQVVRPGVGESTLTVHPPIEAVTPPPVGIGVERESVTGATVVGLNGDDFYALREYRTGDDLRRVHWASSARADHLMIRQEQTIRHGRLLLMADLRENVHTASSLEAALGALASLAVAAQRDGTHVRLVTSAGQDTGYGVSISHRGTVMDVLAAAATHPAAPIGPVLIRLGRDRDGAMILMTTDAAGAGDVAAFARVGQRSMCRAVMIERAPTPPGSRHRDLGAAIQAVRVPYETSFAAIWDRAVRTPRVEAQ